MCATVDDEKVDILFGQLDEDRSGNRI